MYLLAHKVKINTPSGKKDIEGEWDFIKGGIQEWDGSVLSALQRELFEETGSLEFKIMKRFEKPLCFHFPKDYVRKIGYKRQITHMFLVEYMGETPLTPFDDEIDQLGFFSGEDVILLLNHIEIRV